MMKLFRHGPVGQERPGVTLGGKHYDLPDFTEDFTSDFLATDGLERLRQHVAGHVGQLPLLPPGTRMGMPTVGVSKIVCVGFNYARHSQEAGMQLPKEPILFLKATTALCGPDDDIEIPSFSQATDWETELAVVIGRRAKHISKEQALAHVAGYALFNDLSEREYQLERGGQWTKGKSFDTFAHYGPYLVPRDVLPHPLQLPLKTWVNGQLMQDGNTADMVFDVPTLVSYISRLMTLLPGDLIATGTPAGVALGRDPHPYLRPGDVVEQSLGPLGSSRQQCVMG